MAFASGAIATAAGVGYVFGRPVKPKKNSSRLSVHSTSTISNSSKIPKSPFKRFKLFISKNKHLSPTKNVLHQSTIHPLMVHLDNIDDDISSTYSDVTSVYTVDRKISSTPNIPGILAQASDSSSAVARSSLPPSPVSPISLTPPKFRHYRSNSLPPTAIPKSFYRQPTPSESWDDDFDLDNDEINVPNSVEQAQFSLRMDITNIRDFVSQIEELKTLRNKKQFLATTVQSKITRKWSNGFTKSKKKSKKYKDLECRFKQDWEEAAVIIDLSDVAKDRQPTFDGGKKVAVDIEKIPSERHMQVLKKIIVEELGENAQDVIFMDDDKENRYDSDNSDSTSSSGHNPKQQKFTNGESKFNNSDSKRKENFRISVEVMPSLIDHLKKLQDRLSEHVDILGALASASNEINSVDNLGVLPSEIKS
ncbi:811_t:CDS:2 [Gigaspora rosea]|nr:811_t:CDS:2 [Gigaspora rosea]